MSGWRIGGNAGGTTTPLVTELVILAHHAATLDLTGQDAVHLQLQEHGNVDCAGGFNIDLVTAACDVYPSASAEFVTGTGAYGGTDGPSGKITVSAGLDGKVYVENNTTRTLSLAVTSSRAIAPGTAFPAVAGLQAALDAKLGATDAAVATALATAGTSAGSVTAASVPRSYADKARDFPHFFDYVTAQADRDAIRARTNTTEFSTQINQGLSDLGDLGGGTLWLPSGRIIAAGLVIPPVTTLAGAGMGYPPSGVSGTCIQAPARDCTVVIDDTSRITRQSISGLRDVSIQGNLGYRQQAIAFNNTIRPYFTRIFVGNMTLGALSVAGANTGTPHITDCVMFGGYSQSVANREDVGVVYIDCAEPYIASCEFGSINSYDQTAYTALGANPTNAQLWHKSLWMGPNSSDGMIVGVLLEMGDVGLVNNGTRHRFVGISLDGNWGHGILNVAGVSGAANTNSFIGINAQRNSRYSSGVYDAIQFGDASSHDNYVNDVLVNTLTWSGSGFGTGTFGHRYGVYDGGPDVNTTSLGNVVGMIRGDTLTGYYGGSSGKKAGSRHHIKGQKEVTTTGSQTLDASVHSNFRLTMAAQTATITGFTGGTDGDEVSIETVNPQALTHSAGFRLVGGGSRLSGFQERLRFFNDQGNWQEFGFNPEVVSGISADRGDAAYTILNTDAALQLWNTALTADRIAALPAGPHRPGKRCTIQRGAGGTGAFNLNIKTGATLLKALAAASTTATVYWTGSVWVLETCGTL